MRSYGKERYQSTYHERDVESGFDYRGARFYDSDVARFNSLDPLAADFASWPPYNYVLGNPVILIDPDGRAAEQANCCGNRTPPTVGGVLFEAFQNARAGLFNTQVRWFESLIGNHNSTSVRMRVNYNRDGSITVGNPTRIVQEPKKGILAETGDALLDVLALTPAVELGSARNVGAMSGPFLAAKSGGGSSFTSLFRAVSQAEFDDIAENGIRVAPNGYTTGKLFATSATDAREYGRLLQDLDEAVGKGRSKFYIIEVQVPNSVMEQSTRFQADGMKAINVPEELLNQIKY